MAHTILLVNPWIHDFTAYDLWMKPLGLLYIGAYLEQAGYRIILIDCVDRNHPSIQTLPRHKESGCGELPRQVIPKPDIFHDIPRKYKRYGITPESFRTALSGIARTAPPTLIAVTSMMTYWYPGVFESIRLLKEVFPRVPLVLGGLYATLCYEHAQKFSGADYVIKGPGAETVLKLADQIAGQPPHLIPLPQGARLYKADDLDQLPLPAYHLYPKLDYVAMRTSIGCPFHCSYCATPRLIPNLVQRAPEKVVSEITYYAERFRIKDIAFYDDALLVNASRHIEPILELVIKQGLHQRIRFHTPNGLHVKFITQALATKMYQAGFTILRLGFDTAQKVGLEELAQALNYLKKAGYTNQEVSVYVLIGLPGQALHEVIQTVESIHRLGARVSLAQYAPIPGTPNFTDWLNLTHLDGNEPLWHNKSIYPVRTNGIPFRDYEAVKLKAKELNKRL